jgi:hypothetical protein
MLCSFNTRLKTKSSIRILSRTVLALRYIDKVIRCFVFLFSSPSIGTISASDCYNKKEQLKRDRNRSATEETLCTWFNNCWVTLIILKGMIYSLMTSIWTLLHISFLSFWKMCTTQFYYVEFKLFAVIWFLCRKVTQRATNKRPTALYANSIFRDERLLLPVHLQSR